MNSDMKGKTIIMEYRVVNNEDWRICSLGG